MTHRLHRTVIVSAVVALAVITTTIRLGPVGAQGERRVIVLGIDGMDHQLLDRFISEGRLPNFARLAATGSFSPLETTMPPLSPVAWSTFITGMDPGGHGIYDFLHRDPLTAEPLESIYRLTPPGRSLTLGSLTIPISGGDYEAQRQGVAFWELLENAGIDTTIVRMPVNFPLVDTPGRSLSGMGTPDILGTHGTFSFYTDYPPDNMSDITGGVVHLVDVVNNRVASQLVGPPNTFRRFPTNDRRFGRADGEIEYENPDLTIDFEVLLDPEASAAKIVVQDTELILNEGEWSDWVGLNFEAIPFLVNLGASARFYLQEIRPDFKLYVTPLQVDPANPAFPISTPNDWSSEIAASVGRFYTQELPEDTKVFQEGIFSGQEFWEQSQFVYREQRRTLDHVLDSFENGLLFFYFSSVDQGTHMLYHYMDAEHPLHEDDDRLRNGIRTLYEEMDEVLGRLVKFTESNPTYDTTLVVMSDHGFSPFYWGVNLNSWLAEKGYVTLLDPSRQGLTPLFLNVDWSRTTAYAVGLQGLYINLEGREGQGIVAPGTEYVELLDRLEQDLLTMVDERTGQSPVGLVFRTADEWRGINLGDAPDIIVGYSWGYRTSWDSPLGQFPREVFVDNDEVWSGDHSIDYRLVPGVFLSNRQIGIENPSLDDLTVTVLDEFKVEPLPEMLGQDALR